MLVSNDISYVEKYVFLKYVLNHLKKDALNAIFAFIFQTIFTSIGL